MIRRIHNSNCENLAFKNVKTQKRYIGFIYGKPNGLWYGIDGDWLRWCKSEAPEWVHQYNYELKIDLSKMLVISNKKQLLQFYNQYHKSKSQHVSYIDWNSVANDYTGIEINPHLYECRLLMNCLWYYGCLLDVSGIKVRYYL